MNVQGVVSSYVVKAYDAKVSKAGKVTEPEAPKPNGERVEVSASSDEVQAVRQFVDALPDVRIQVVEEIQERIKNNDYPLDNRLSEAIEKLTTQEILLNI